MVTNVSKRGIKLSRLVFSLFLISLFVCCLVVAMKKIVWTDELLSLYSTQDDDLGHMIDGMSVGINAMPPLYFFITWTFFHLGIKSILFFRLFTCACFGTAAYFFWRKFRKSHNEPVVISMIILIFGASPLVFNQLAEFRVYGFLFLLLSALFLYASRLLEAHSSTKRIVLLAVIMALCSLTHVYGVIYGMAVGLAFVINDAANKKVHWKIYAALATGMAMLPLLWWKNLILQAESGKPHSWMVVPEPFDLTRMITFLLPYGVRMLKRFPPALLTLDLILIIFAVLLLTIRRVPLFSQKPFTNQERFYIILSCSWIIVPMLLSYCISHISTSIFNERYFMPGILGVLYLAILLVDRLNVSRYIIAVVCGIAIVAGFRSEIKESIEFKNDHGTTAMSKISKIGVQPVIFESPNEYLVAKHYYPQLQSIYPLDWPMALDKSNFLGAVVDYKLLDGLKKYYAVDGVKQAKEILQPGKVYYVFESDRYNWLEHYIHNKTLSIQHIYHLNDWIYLYKVKVNSTQDSLFNLTSLQLSFPKK